MRESVVKFSKCLIYMTLLAPLTTLFECAIISKSVKATTYEG